MAQSSARSLAGWTLLLLLSLRTGESERFKKVSQSELVEGPWPPSANWGRGLGTELGRAQQAQAGRGEGDDDEGARDTSEGKWTGLIQQLGRPGRRRCWWAQGWSQIRRRRVQVLSGELVALQLVYSVELSYQVTATDSLLPSQIPCQTTPHAVLSILHSPVPPSPPTLPPSAPQPSIHASQPPSPAPPPLEPSQLPRPKPRAGGTRSTHSPLRPSTSSWTMLRRVSGGRCWGLRGRGGWRRRRKWKWWSRAGRTSSGRSRWFSCRTSRCTQTIRRMRSRREWQRRRRSSAFLYAGSWWRS